MAKFEKEFKTYSNTKKKDLLVSIKKAKEIYDSKEEKQNKPVPAIEEKPKQSISISPLKPIESNSSKKDDSSVSLLKKKTKRRQKTKWDTLKELDTGPKVYTEGCRTAV